MQTDLKPTKINHLFGAVSFVDFEARAVERSEDYYVALARLMAKAGFDVREHNIGLKLDDETLEHIHRQYADLQ